MNFFQLFQVDKLTASLHQIQDSFKNTRDALSTEVNERQDALIQSRADLEKARMDHEQNLIKVHKRFMCMRRRRVMRIN